MKPETRQKAETLLKSVNLRQTTQRFAVIAVLLNAHKPQTAEDIINKLKQNRPNKVTVYRILRSFVNVGIVHRAFVQKRKCHYELAHNCTEQFCHPHFTCTRCGETQCLIALPIPVVKGLTKDFVVQRQQIRLEGLCPQCS